MRNNRVVRLWMKSVKKKKKKEKEIEMLDLYRGFNNEKMNFSIFLLELYCCFY